MRIILIALLCIGFGTAHATERKQVDIELVMLVDASGSIDKDEHKLQLAGIVVAFKNPHIINAIKNGYRRAVAVTVVGFGASQRVYMPWTRLYDEDSAVRFADGLAEISHKDLGGTAIGDALAYAHTLFGKRFRGDFRIIDISGDEKSNSGVPVTPVRQQIIEDGITINGLPIIDSDQNVVAYYKTEVIGGVGAFVIPAKNRAAILQAYFFKLVKELARK